MISQVRKALKGFVAWVFVILLIVAFAAWGVPSLSSFAQRPSLTVGKEDFSNAEVVQEFNRQMRQRQISTEGVYTREDALRDNLMNATIQNMTVRSAAVQEAERLGLAMPRSELREVLNSDPRFQNPRTGKFDQEILGRILQAYEFRSVAEFEEQVRSDLLRETLVDAISSGSPAPGALVNYLLLREVEKRKIRFLTVSEDMAGIPTEPTPPDLEAFYNENIALFTRPELRRFSAVILTNSAFSDPNILTEEEIRALYDRNRERQYETPERRTFYRATFDSETEAAAAVASLRRGEPFEAIAAQKELPLGAVTFENLAKSDLTEPAVAEAVFDPALGEGDVADPIRNVFGWAVVQIAGLTPPATTPYEEVRDQIAEQYASDDARRKLFDAIELIENERITGTSLEAAAEAAGVAVERFGPVDSFSFGPGGEIIADIPAEVLAEAFEINEGDETEAIQFDDESGYFLIAVNEVEAPTPIPFDEVAEEVETRWRANDRDTRIANTVNQIRDAIRGGQSIDDAAAPLNRAPLDRTLERRNNDDDQFSEDLQERIFSAAPGDVVTGDVGIGAGGVVAVVEEIDFDFASLGPADRIGYQQFLTYQIEQELLDAYAEMLQLDLGVKVNQAQIDNAFAEVP